MFTCLQSHQRPRANNPNGPAAGLLDFLANAATNPVGTAINLALGGGSGALAQPSHGLDPSMAGQGPAAGLEILANPHVRAAILSVLQGALGGPGASGAVRFSRQTS